MSRIFLAEDDENAREGLKASIERSTHTLNIVATTLNEALAAIGKLAEAKIEIAILDGNLTPGVNSGDDGRKIAEEIRKLNLGIVIITWSLSEYDWGDILVPKCNIHNRSLMAKLDEISKGL